MQTALRLSIRAGLVAGAVLLLVFSSAALGTTRIGSFNLLHYGWNNHKNVPAVAAVAAQFDLIAIQELMKPEALAGLEKALEQRTGVAWEHMASGAKGRSTYREHYGFIWRTDKVAYTGRAVSYIDDRDLFAREPFSAVFKRLDTGDTIALATVHIMFGDSKADRRPEIVALSRYWAWLSEVYPDADLQVLTGDMNMPPTDKGWQALDKHARLLITRGKSTLSTTPGQYASLYDQIVVPDAWQGEAHTAGIFVYPRAYGWGWAVRDQISDHLPVYLVLGNDTFTLRDYGDVSGLMVAAKQPAAPTCIGLNVATAKRLAELPHVGAARAKAIIAGRPWQSIKALVSIKGLSKNRVGNIATSGLLCDPVRVP